MGPLPPDVEALFEHPEFIVIKEQMNKTSVENLSNFIGSLYINR